MKAFCGRVKPHVYGMWQARARRSAFQHCPDYLWLACVSHQIIALNAQAFNNWQLVADQHGFLKLIISAREVYFRHQCLYFVTSRNLVRMMAEIPNANFQHVRNVPFNV